MRTNSMQHPPPPSPYLVTVFKHSHSESLKSKQPGFPLLCYLYIHCYNYPHCDLRDLFALMPSCILSWTDIISSTSAQLKTALFAEVIYSRGHFTQTRAHGQTDMESNQMSGKLRDFQGLRMEMSSVAKCATIATQYCLSCLLLLVDYCVE